MIKISFAIIAAVCMGTIPAKAVAGTHQTYQITIITTKGKVSAKKPLSKAHIRQIDAKITTKLAPVPENAISRLIGQALKPGSFTALMSNEVAKPYVSSCKEGSDYQVHQVMSIYHTGYTILLVSFKGELKVIYNLSDARNLHPHDAGPCTVESPNINVVQGVKTFHIQEGKTWQVLIHNPKGQDKAILIRMI
jgi:hypothetical protein